ncbi:hypothetical protein PoB_001723300 [Plakobranchus ocellatus]|uniref:Uncharacterized protein n=1 Tax=Plakobranchus ocellatus TaxID=259542 RepID=A0AAV3Z8F4_9GAST|nr:hypothetical protein PoB_001723300 [Plakobranchus ocellatus]
MYNVNAATPDHMFVSGHYCMHELRSLVGLKLSVDSWGDGLLRDSSSSVVNLETCSERFLRVRRYTGLAARRNESKIHGDRPMPNRISAFCHRDCHIRIQSTVDRG